MKNSYRLKLILFTLFFLTAVSVTITVIGTKYIKTTSIQAFAERGISVVYQAKSLIEPAEFDKLVKGNTPDCDYYDALYTKFYQIKKEQNCKFLYTMVPVSGTNYKYIVDGAAKFSDEFSPFGTVEDISSYGNYPAICMETKEVIVSDIIKQEGWGWTVSVYAPIVLDNKAIGFIACDYDVEKLVSNINLSRTKMIIYASAIAVAGIIFLIIYISIFFKRLNGVTKAMQNISSGARDLTQRLKIKGDSELDSLSKAYNDVIEQLQGMVKDINRSIKTLSENSTVLLNQNNETVALIENAKTSIEEIYAQADDQNSLSEQVASGISGVETAVKILDEKIIQQSEAVEKSSSAVEEINTNIAAANEAIGHISNEYAVIVKETEDGRTKQNEVTKQVDLIVKQAQNLAQANEVISNIAAQTNLLAMNAAIEAAHAGEAGKGFSVVSDEIRKLAENSAKQSTAVSDLIDNIEKSISDIVTVSKSSAQSFTSLGEKIQGMDGLLVEIKSDMEKQNVGAQNILDMMSLLASATVSIKESSAQMKDNTIAVVGQIEELKESSQSILASGNNANEQLLKMNEFAAVTTSQTAENADLTASVDEIVSSYKVES
ncbi:MAG: methyl-accepting chemotaxis protein [Treponema sp.]|uniref:methyl-accepting chemotaxis protein n=1 Tax=Treponema sp. TaxID=166 RepID=UPI00298DB288|nr:methyl-accepting chemotaxis protein [Treponema sp.]MCQ2601242.1 methyl-accepting chemotaxis protein [Treponema sp.]